jgi:hypothetical protein
MALVLKSPVNFFLLKNTHIFEWNQEWPSPSVLLIIMISYVIAPKANLVMQIIIEVVLLVHRDISLEHPVTRERKTWIMNQ